MELRNYLQIVQVDSDTDPLDWWKYLQVNFPGVAKLARKYLFIPATSAPSVFTDVNIITSYKFTPKPEAMDGLVFPMQNLQRLNELQVPKPVFVGVICTGNNHVFYIHIIWFHFLMKKQEHFEHANTVL